MKISFHCFSFEQIDLFRVIEQIIREVTMRTLKPLVLMFVFSITSSNSASIKRENSSSIRKNLDSGSNSTGESQEDKEVACWNVIIERSAVAFALQNRVLNELQVELLDSPNLKTRAKVNQLADTMRATMNEAIGALKVESAERYFGALFKLSDNIVQFSTILRDPENDDREILPTLAKAVSRLGRHNSNLVQEITERCSLLKKSPIY